MKRTYEKPCVEVVGFEYPERIAGWVNNVWEDSGLEPNDNIIP